MLGIPTYDCDTEFRKLLERRTDVDVTIAALEFARDAYPNLLFEPTLNWIGERAVELAGPIARARNERAALETLSEALSVAHRLHGDQTHFDDPDCSYLHRVIETGRGIPISLSVVYMAVANRVGIELRGSATPAHFLARCETSEGILFVDPYHSGRLLSRDEAIRWLSQLAKMPKRSLASTLGEASPRTIVIRMLNNLKILYARHEQWREAWKVQHRLTMLQPSSYEEQRDLAILTVRMNWAGPAIGMLETLIAQCPEHDRSTLDLMLQEARGQLHRWN